MPEQRPHTELAAFVDRHGDRVAEVMWSGAMVLLRQALDDAERDDWGRWRANPRRQLRVLRQGMAAGLELARLATSMQDDQNERYRELTAGLDAEREAASRRDRQYASRQALKVKALRARCRAEGRKPSWDEIYAAQAEAARELGIAVDDDLVLELNRAVRKAAG